MKNKYIVANWKANNNQEKIEKWFADFSKALDMVKSEFSGKIIICPPFPYLKQCRELIEKYYLNISLGVQDISKFSNGSYTGEVTALMVAEYADLVILGHSERRKYFGENEEVLEKKVELAKEAGLEVIFCIQDEDTYIPKDISFIAYEPVWAIGTGEADNPQNASEVLTRVKEKYEINTALYGGSVKKENIADFLKSETIDGVLVGGASLEAKDFLSLIFNASKS